MKKRLIFPIVISGLLLAGFVFAQPVTIPNPLGANTFCELLLGGPGKPWGIIPAVAGFVGALSTIMIIVAGILYLTSAGSPEKMTKAKTALIYAIAGIVIAISADAIVAIIKTTLGASGSKC